MKAGKLDESLIAIEAVPVGGCKPIQVLVPVETAKAIAKRASGERTASALKPAKTRKQPAAKLPATTRPAKAPTKAKARPAKQHPYAKLLERARRVHKGRR